MKDAEHEQRLFQVISDLNPSYVSQAEKRPTAPIFRGLGAVAAALAVVISLFALSGLWGGGDAEGALLGITAYAENGVSNVLAMNQTVLSSIGTEKENIFGVDMPLFSLEVAPEGWDDQQAMYNLYTLDITYPGQTLLPNGRDPHIFVAYLASAPWAPEPVSRYSVVGWFEEPVELTITLRHKETGVVAERQTLRVAYDAAAQSYEITLLQIEKEPS